MSWLSAIDKAVADSKNRFSEDNKRSGELHDVAALVLPGSNTRAPLYHAPYPIRMASGEGCTLKSVDGKEYMDMIGEYSAGLFGHSDERILKALHEALDDGINLGSNNEYEIQLAKLLVDRFPSLDQVRFTNSGTEANLYNIALAKAFTKRSKIIVFEGGCHGGVFTFKGDDIDSLVNIPHEWIIAKYNDANAIKKLIRQVGDRLAAVLVEPMQGPIGCFPAKTEFLQTIRQETSAIGALLIFDEVMTSRLYWGGAQEHFGITPDLTSLGKYLGGGMSFGCIGGRRDIMAFYDPSSPSTMVHGGTFNNNVLSMRAGVVALRDVFTADEVLRLNGLGDELRHRLNEFGKKYKVKLQVTGVGSLMTIHWSDQVVEDVKSVKGVDKKCTELFFLEMLHSGVFISKRGFIALTLAHKQEHINIFIERVETFIQKYRDILSVF